MIACSKFILVNLNKLILRYIVCVIIYWCIAMKLNVASMYPALYATNKDGTFPKVKIRFQEKTQNRIQKWHDNFTGNWLSVLFIKKWTRIHPEYVLHLFLKSYGSQKLRAITFQQSLHHIEMLSFEVHSLYMLYNKGWEAKSS